MQFPFPCKPAGGSSEWVHAPSRRRASIAWMRLLVCVSARAVYPHPQEQLERFIEHWMQETMCSRHDTWSEDELNAFLYRVRSSVAHAPRASRAPASMHAWMTALTAVGWGWAASTELD